MDVTELKRRAAEKAVEFVESGMVVGLGHGSTAIWAIRRIGKMLAAGELSDIVGVPCSRQVEIDARDAGIRLTTLEDYPQIDLTIDGADEVDPKLNVIKGGGGALLREKVVATASRREIIVVDERKCTAALGTRFAVPVEVIPFGWKGQVTFLAEIGGEATLRRGEGGGPFVTDQGNWILDCRFAPLLEPTPVADAMAARAGIIEHGLFLGLITDVIVAGSDGLEHRTRPA